MLTRLITTMLMLPIFLATVPSLAQDEEGGAISTQTPKMFSAPVRLIPVAGASSFSTDNTVNTNRIDETFSIGILADFGESDWTFETGLITVQSTANRNIDPNSINVDTWGIPLLAKLNLSGKPNETVFFKIGGMPFIAAGDAEDFDLMGVIGLGAAIPLNKKTALVLDATYNSLITTGGELTDYDGVALLAGVSFSL